MWEPALFGEEGPRPTVNHGSYTPFKRLTFFPCPVCGAGFSQSRHGSLLGWQPGLMPPRTFPCTIGSQMAISHLTISVWKIAAAAGTQPRAPVEAQLRVARERYLYVWYEGFPTWDPPLAPLRLCNRHLGYKRWRESPFLRNVKNRQIHRNKRWINICQDSGKEGLDRDCSWCGVSLRGEEMF